MVSSLIKKAKESLAPKVVKGNHLTVTTHPNGKVELEWDWDALVSEVRAACLKAESVLPVGVDVKPAKKKAAPKKATKVEEPKVVEKPKTKRKTKENK